MNKFTATLDRLASEGKIEALKHKEGSQIELDIDQIISDPNQPRKQFDELSLKELADSIAEHGILQAITVKPKNDAGEYELIMGERRLRAARLVGLSKIPAVIKTFTSDLYVIQLIENIQRENLTTLELAHAIEQLAASGLKRDEIAIKLGWSKSHISLFSNINKMPEAFQKLANQNVSVRALNDLYKVWQDDEEKAKTFIETCSADEITKSSVMALKAAHDNLLDDEQSLIPIYITDPSLTKSSKSPKRPKKLVLRCKYQTHSAHIMMNYKPSEAGLLFIQLDEDGSIIEVDIHGIELGGSAFRQMGAKPPERLGRKMGNIKSCSVQHFMSRFSLMQDRLAAGIVLQNEQQL